MDIVAELCDLMRTLRFCFYCYSYFCTFSATFLYRYKRGRFPRIKENRRGADE